MPFGRNDFFNEGFLAEIFERIFWESFDVVSTDMSWVRDEGSIDCSFELDNEGTEAGSKRLESFSGVVALHVGKLLVVRLCGSFKQG